MPLTDFASCLMHKYANVQPHSGAQANMAVMLACLKPGDTFMGLHLDMGGHLTHGSPVNISGKMFHAVPYGLTPDGYVDYDQMEKIAFECKPKTYNWRRISVFQRVGVGENESYCR